MINKLRKRFILVAMLAIFGVLTVIMVTVNVVNYVRVNGNSDRVIKLLEDGGGDFPVVGPGDDRWNGISHETPFEARFYTVVLDSDGDVVSVDLKRIAAIKQKEAIDSVKYLYDNGKAHGMYGDFKYTTLPQDDGTMYIMLDCGKDLYVFRNFLMMSILISLAGLAVVFVLVFFLSGRVFRPVEEGYRKQKSFITNAGHDLRTPLTVIGAAAELIEAEHGSSEYTDEIKKQVAKLSALTDKLVFLTGLDERMGSIEMSEFDLSAALVEMSEPYIGAGAAKDLTVTVDVPDGIKYVGNAEMFARAFSLLMDNAVKYTPAGGNITVAAAQGKVLSLRFSNDVSGMAAGGYDSLFDRFSRADRSRNSETGGNGIGLSVVKAIIDVHKGSITASCDGAGFEIDITL